MITQLDQKTKDRVNLAIHNVRLIATRTKRASLLDATQKAEIVVNLLNEFRQYINFTSYLPVASGETGTFKHNQETLGRITQAIFQADNVYNMLARANKKRYQDEYHQVVVLLENIHAWTLKITEGRASNAKS
jgi:hypothetical protein